MKFKTAPSNKLGIIGGMGSMAGVVLAQKIIQHSPALSDQQHIEFILHNNTRVPDRTKAILSGGSSPLSELIRSIKFLDQQGVDLIVMACMTSYFYKDKIKSLSNAFLIDPMEILRELMTLNYTGTSRVGLLASTGIIKAGLFHRLFESVGIEVVTLSAYEQERILMKAIYQKYGLKSGYVSDHSRQLLNSCVDSLLENRIDIIIGGCSEISSESFNKSLSIPFIDILDVTAKRIVEMCYYSEPVTEINK